MKMAAMQAPKRRLASTRPTDKEKALNEIEEGLGRIATPRKHTVALMHRFSSSQRKTEIN